MIDEKDPTEETVEVTNPTEGNEREEAEAREEGQISDAQLDDAAGGRALM